MQKITVGMPLYNNEKTLSRAIDSVLAQKGVDLTLLLSNDDSSDKTWEICQSYAAKDPRVKIVHQKQNLYYQNFMYLLKNSTTEYFCWLAGDDYLADTFLLKCLSELENDKSLISCNSKCQWTLEHHEKLYAKGTFSIEDENPSARIVRYLNKPSDNTRMYGVFRRDVLLKCFPLETFHAYDWALSALTLSFGGQREINEVLMYRDKTSSKSYANMVKRDHSFFLLRWFPVAYMSWYLLKHPMIPKSFNVIKALIKINIYKKNEYNQYK
jgi:glycosyltransferase involved in cell wall biosynthesis